MPRPCVPFVALAVAAACLPADSQSPAPPPVVFDGFGLGDLSSAASVARALQASGAGASGPGPAFDVVVRGPGGGRPPTEPLAAEVRGRIDGIDLAAGLQGDAEALAGRTPRWTGRIGVGDAGPDGGGVLELRTQLESRAGAGRVGVEIGPRFERRLPRGARVFLDGAASAEAVRAAEAGDWQLPGTSTADSAAALGVSARTGIIR